MNRKAAPDVLAHIASLIPMKHVGRAEEVAELELGDRPAHRLVNADVQANVGSVGDVGGDHLVVLGTQPLRASASEPAGSPGHEGPSSRAGAYRIIARLGQCDSRDT
jgi:hypothetical protein